MCQPTSQQNFEPMCWHSHITFAVAETQRVGSHRRSGADECVGSSHRFEQPAMLAACRPHDGARRRAPRARARNRQRQSMRYEKARAGRPQIGIALAPSRRNILFNRGRVTRGQSGDTTWLPSQSPTSRSTSRSIAKRCRRSAAAAVRRGCTAGSAVCARNAERRTRRQPVRRHQQLLC